jgi:hypothetical protein
MLRLHQSVIASLGAIIIAQAMIRTASQAAAIDKGMPLADVAASTLHTARLAHRHGSLSLGQTPEIEVGTMALGQSIRLSGLRPAHYPRLVPNILRGRKGELAG